MKYLITTTEFAALSDDQKALYGAEKDGNHTFKIDGMPDFATQETRIAAMDAKVEQLLTETKTAKTAKKLAETELAKVTKKKADDSGDIDAINASWQTKYDNDVGEANTARDDAMGMLRTEKIHTKAIELATTLAVPGSANVLLPHIQSRLSMEIKDGRAVAVVLDKAGKPSALTIEELGKEIASDKAFAPLIVASNASGSGANGANGSGATEETTIKRVEFDAMSQTQRSEFSLKGGNVVD